jgi:hypothetical protein
MPEASTPLTIGLFFIAAFGFTASTGFLLWIWRQLRTLKDEILGLVRADTERTTKAMDELATRIGAVVGELRLLNERTHALELARANDRVEMAEKYMSKTSATGAIERVETAVTDMKRDLGTRLNSIEGHLRKGLPPPT